MSPYKYQVNFSKRIQTGFLAGRLYHDHLRFATEESAKAFKERLESGVVIKPCAGVSDYIAEDATMFEIEPMNTVRN